MGKREGFSSLSLIHDFHGIKGNKAERQGESIDIVIYTHRVHDKGQNKVVGFSLKDQCMAATGWSRHQDHTVSVSSAHHDWTT